MTNRADASSTRGRTKGDAGEVIARTAARAFADEGFHAVSIRDIAHRAGVSLSTVYWHFENKNDLLRALLEAATVDYEQSWRLAVVEAGPDPLARLDALVRTTIEYRVRHQLESNLLLSEMRNLESTARDRLGSIQREASSTLDEIIKDGIAEGLFHTRYPSDARRSVFAICNSVARWYDPAGDLSMADLVVRYQTLARSLVGVDDTTGSP